MSTTDPSNPIESIRRFLDILHPAKPDGSSTTFEIRALNVPSKRAPKPITISGYFDSTRECPTYCHTVDGRRTTGGIYVTINPVEPSLLERADRKLVDGLKPVTHDSDIVCRRWLIIDIDPIRPKNTAATEAERQAAAEGSEQLADFLDGEGWPEPVIVDSGNGRYLLYRVDLPNDEDSRALIERATAGLIASVHLEGAKVDPSVTNAARIIRVAGTMNRRGKSTAERPHRMAAVVSEPLAMEVVDREKLEALAERAPKVGTGGKTSHPALPGAAAVALEAPTPAPSQAPTPRHNIPPAALETAVRNYVGQLDPAISGSGGHGTTYRMACVLVVDWGLTVEEAWPWAVAWNQTCVPPWSEKDLRRKLEQADQSTAYRGKLQDALAESLAADVVDVEFDIRPDAPAAVGSLTPAKPDGSSPETTTTKNPVTITNADVEYFTDEAGKEGQRIVPRPMNVVVASILEAGNDWPRNMDGALFVPCPESPGGVHWLSDTAGLFGWIQGQYGVVDWHRTRGCVSKEETMRQVQMQSKTHSSIENYPHEPPLENAYYTCPMPKPGDGQALDDFLDRFCPATDDDRELMKAAMVTLLWASPIGVARPAFLFTGEGRGTGKTKTAEFLARPFGQIMQFSSGERIEDIKARLLGLDAVCLRVAMLDNIKSPKFSWAELEALLTASHISGKRMYHGNAARPNLLTWFLTLNGPSLGSDMAERAVTIKLNAAPKDGDWETDTLRMVDRLGPLIINDLYSLLTAPPQPMERYTRFGTWCKTVLSKLRNPDRLVEVIKLREGENDAEHEESSAIEACFSQRLEHYGIDPEKNTVVIPSSVAVDWLKIALKENYKLISGSRLLRQKIKEGKMSRLTEGDRHGPRKTTTFEWHGLHSSFRIDDLEKVIAAHESGHGEISHEF